MAALLGALALALVAGCGGAGRESRGDMSALARTCDRTARVSVGQPVVVGRGAGALTASGGSVWVAFPRAGRVVSVRDRRVASSTSVAGRPVALVVGLGRVWVAAAGADRLVRLDPRSGRVTGRTAVDMPVDVAIVGGFAWALSLDDGALYPISPQGLRYEAIGVPVVAPKSLATNGSDLWSMGAGDAGLVPVDTSLNRVVRDGLRVPVASVAAIAAGDHDLWVAAPRDRVVVRVDTRSLDLASFPAPAQLRPTAVAVTPCAVWVADGASGRLVALDAVSGVPLGAPVRVGRSVAALAPDGNAVWASDPIRGTVRRLALSIR